METLLGLVQSPDSPAPGGGLDNSLTLPQEETEAAVEAWLILLRRGGRQKNKQTNKQKNTPCTVMSPGFKFYLYFFQISVPSRWMNPP